MIRSSSDHPLRLRWLKFNAVGVIGIGVQLAVLTLLRTGVHLSIFLATALAVEAAVVHNFFWHERFTWVDRRNGRNAFLRFLKFNFTTGAFSITGNTLLTVLLMNNLHISYFLADCMAVAVCSVGNFVVNDRLVFGSASVK